MRLRRSATCALLLASTVALAAPAARAADPTTSECLGASESALKLFDDHKLRDARAQFLVCAASSCPDDVRSECARHVTELVSAIPTVVFQVKDAAGNDVVAVKVTMDGAPLVDKLDGAAVAVDPGQHAFTFEVEGQPPVQRSIVIREGERDRHEDVALGAAPAVAPADAPVAPPDASAPPDAAPPPSPAPPPSELRGGLSSWAIILGGVGVAGVGVGAAFGVLASSSWSKAKSECGPGTGCPQYSQAVDDHNSAASSAVASTIAFSVGGAALVAAGVAWWASTKESKPATTGSLRALPVVGDRAGGFAIYGNF